MANYLKIQYALYNSPINWSMICEINMLKLIPNNDNSMSFSVYLTDIKINGLLKIPIKNGFTFMWKTINNITNFLLYILSMNYNELVYSIYNKYDNYNNTY